MIPFSREREGWWAARERGKCSEAEGVRWGGGWMGTQLERENRLGLSRLYTLSLLAS